MDWSIWYSYLVLPVCFPLSLPLVIGCILVFSFKQDKVARLSGLFVLKPVLTYPIWIFLFALSNGEHSLSLAIIRAIPAISATSILIYYFRDQFVLTNMYPWLLLFFDTLRWGNTYLVDVNSEYSIGITIGLLLPSAYAVLALVLVFVHRKKHGSASR